MIMCARAHVCAHAHAPVCLPVRDTRVLVCVRESERRREKEREGERERE